MYKKWESTFRVGVYTCEMIYTEKAGIKCQWRPDLPRSLTEQQREQYRAGRDALLAEVGKDMGGQVLVIET